MSSQFYFLKYYIKNSVSYDTEFYFFPLNLQFLIFHVFESFQTLLGLDLLVAVTDLGHRHKGQ